MIELNCQLLIELLIANEVLPLLDNQSNQSDSKAKDSSDSCSMTANHTTVDSNDDKRNKNPLITTSKKMFPQIRRILGKKLSSRRRKVIRRNNYL
jgi:hypothetical protein